MSKATAEFMQKNPHAQVSIISELDDQRLIELAGIAYEKQEQYAKCENCKQAMLEDMQRYIINALDNYEW